MSSTTDPFSDTTMAKATGGPSETSFQKLQRLSDRLGMGPVSFGRVDQTLVDALHLVLNRLDRVEAKIVS